jgi:hypothetical protein
MNQYNEQGDSVDGLEDSYQGLFASDYQNLKEIANIFDLNVNEEKFEDLSSDNLKKRKSYSTTTTTTTATAAVI